MKSRFIIALLVLNAASLCVASAKATEHGTSSTCAALAGLEIPASRISLPTRGAKLASAEAEEEGWLCTVKGAIEPIDPKAPNINFQINLPSNWNGKAVHAGGGAYDGFVADGRHLYGIRDDDPLKKGFATFGSDSGHQVANSQNLLAEALKRHGKPVAAMIDASFASNPEALQNFAGAQLKKVHDVTMDVMVSYYGKQPRRVYFYGGSQGGHEALIVAQRYPADYDGVISLFPAYDFTALQLGGLAIGQRLYSSKGAWLSPAKTALIASAVLRSCDGLDGLIDDIVANLAACRAAFHVQPLRCPSGRDEGSSCLSDAEIATAEFVSRPISFGFTVGGLSGFAGWPIFEGAFSPGATIGFGSQPVPDRPAGDSDAADWIIADQTVRYLFMGDPALDSLTFVPPQHVAAIQRIADMLDASSPNLDAFRRHGGKLLLMHGTVDMAIPPGNTIAYYDRLKQRYGTGMRNFVRFYLAPGMGHGDGPFRASWDALSALDRWVDRSESPTAQVAVDMMADHYGRSRPLCEYPTWPKYRGVGDPNLARSFQCVFK